MVKAMHAELLKQALVADEPAPDGDTHVPGEGDD